MANDYQAVTSGGCKPSTQDLERNAPLLVGYEYEKYVTCITGYNGMNLQQITVCQHFPAVRVRIGPQGNYKAGFCRLEDGTLILASCRLVNDEFQIYVYESRDEGLTWNEIGETELYGKEPCLTLLPDGSLFLTAQPPITPVLDNTQVVSYRSTDNAVNWETFIIDGPDYPRSIIVELDGSLLMVRSKMAPYARGAYEEAGKPFTPSSNLELIRSSDGGQTWSRSEGEVAWEHEDFGEVSAVRLPNGHLLATLRGNPPETGGEGFEITWLTESSDNGETWCEPWVMSNTAEVHVNLLLLRDGRLLATYANYHLPFGICAVVSEDNGKSWSYDQPIQLAVSADMYTGWPVTLELPGDDLITSYAITPYLNQPPDRSVCEVVRWRLPD